MAFKLTYTDGQEDTYDDETAWTVEDAVLKMGRKEGHWTVLVSPSHWATVEVTKADKKDSGEKDTDEKDTDEKDTDEKDDKDTDE